MEKDEGKTRTKRGTKEGTLIENFVFLFILIGN